MSMYYRMFFPSSSWVFGTTFCNFNWIMACLNVNWLCIDYKSIPCLHNLNIFQLFLYIFLGNLVQRSLSNWLIHSLELLKHELLRWCSIDLDRHTHTTHKEQKDTSKKCEEEVHFCKMAAATLNAFRSLFGSMNLGQKARLLCDSPKRKPWPKKGSSSASSSIL